MKHGVRIFGTALGALLAMAALAVTAASASEFKAGAYPVDVHGTQLGQNTITLTSDSGATVKCTTTTTSGSLSAAGSTLQLHPTYSGCSAFGFGSASVNTEGCDYAFHLTGPASGGRFDGEASILCTEGSAIRITAGNCEVTIGAQKGLSTMGFRNMPGPQEHITAVWSVSGLSYTVDKDGFLCPLSGTGAKSGGDIAGLETITGESEGSPTDLTVEGSEEHEEETAAAAKANEEAEEEKAEAGEAASGETLTGMGAGSPLTAAGYPVDLSAAQDGEDPLMLGAGEETLAECSTVIASGTLSGASSTITLHPEFAGCVSLGSSGATVEADGCDLRLHVWSTTGGGPAYETTMDVICEIGRWITITAGTCEVEIHSQWGLGVGEAVNVEGSPETVSGEFEVGELAYEVNGTGLFCPLGELGEFTDGTLAGTVELSGSAEEEAVPIALEM